MKYFRLAGIFFLLISLMLITACDGGSTPFPEATFTPKPTRTPRPTRTPTPTVDITIEPTTTALSEGVSDLDLQGVAVKFWHPWTQDKEYAILSLVNEYNANNPHGIVVTAFSQGGEIYKNVLAAQGSSRAPHVVIGYNDQIQSWDNLMGPVVNLNDYVNDPYWGLSPGSQENFYPIIWQQDVGASDKRLGLPVYRSTVVIFYNQSWAQELGFPQPPLTSNELREQACVAATANLDNTGGWIATSDISANMSWLMAFGGSLLNSSGNQYQAMTPENEAAFNFLRNLFDMGCAWTPEDYHPNQEFATRKGLFYPSSIAGIPFQENAFVAADSQDQWTVLPFPGENGQPVINLYGPAYAIMESTPEEQLASWLFIKWMLEPQNQARFIEASGYLPVSAAALGFLDEYVAENPLWAQVVTMIPYGKTEPALGSWGVARWAFGDAIEELFSPNFDSEQVPTLLEKLEETLNDIHVNNP